MNTPDKPWYIVVAAVVLALGFGFAAFWLLAFTSVETGTAFAFLSPAILIVGFITGQSVPSAVTGVLNRASVAPAPEPNQPSVIEADTAYLNARMAQRAEADAALAAQSPPAS